MDKAKVIRRPIKARETKWASRTAQWLTRSGVQPNQISILSIVLAVLAGASLILVRSVTPGWGITLFVSAAAFIQLRLLCNLFDGMVAIEGGLKSKTGEIFNEFPDRLSDVMILVGAGYSMTSISWATDLGWMAAILAVTTAYVRAFGGSVGTSQNFCGPMAKAQRMGVMTAACLIAAVEAATGWNLYAMTVALGIIVFGCIVTIVRRTLGIVKELESR